MTRHTVCETGDDAFKFPETQLNQYPADTPGILLYQNGMLETQSLNPNCLVKIHNLKHEKLKKQAQQNQMAFHNMQ